MAQRAIDRDRMILRTNDKENKKKHTHTNQEKKRQKVKKQNEERVRTTNSENGILSSIWRVLSILISYLYRMNCITLCYPQTYFPDQVCSIKTQHKNLPTIWNMLRNFLFFYFFISWIFFPFLCRIIWNRLKFGMFFIHLGLFFIFSFLNLPKKFFPRTSKKTVVYLRAFWCLIVPVFLYSIDFKWDCKCNYSMISFFFWPIWFKHIDNTPESVKLNNNLNQWKTTHDMNGNAFFYDAWAMGNW